MQFRQRLDAINTLRMSNASAQAATNPTISHKQSHRPDVKIVRSGQLSSRWLQLMLSQRWPRYLIGFALFVCLPSLWAGFMSDDHYIRARFLAPGIMPLFNDFSFFGLFSIAEGTQRNLDQLVQHGLLPWFTEPDFHFKLSRPLAELSHAFDFLLWPNTPLLMHIHHLLWLCAFYFSALLLYRKLFSENRLLFSIALAWVVLDSNMSQTIIWLAARNTLMAATFSVLSLYFYVAADQEQKKSYLALSVVSYALGLFSSEFALGGAGYFLAYCIWMQSGGYKRFLALLPFGLVGSLWAAAYLMGKQGVAGSGFYIDPISDTSGYLLTLVSRYPAYIFHQLFFIPFPTFTFIENFNIYWWLELTTVALFFWVVRRAFRFNQFKFLMAGALFALLPISASPGGPRIMLLAGIGFAPIIAYLIQQWISLDASHRLRKLGFTVLGFHALSFLFWMLLFTYEMTIIDVRYVQQAARNLPVSDDDATKQWIVLNSPATFWTNQFPLIRAVEGKSNPAAWY
ncbi:MAG TPA: hypothetical protein VFM46_10240, partial [Pseudomonadales bacterium]|nr:hypothetical protein [Pseudomonadales bacterium]